MTTKEKGNWGEEKASEYLENIGFKIVKRNFHTRFGEIDIIAKDKKTLVFVEVKTRKNNKFANAMEYVDYNKQQKIIKSAMLYLSDNDNIDSRFDVIEVYYTEKKRELELLEINHIKNAFIVEK